MDSENKKKFNYEKIMAAVEEEYQRVRNECDTYEELYTAANCKQKVDTVQQRDFYYGVSRLVEYIISRDWDKVKINHDI